MLMIVAMLASTEETLYYPNKLIYRTINTHMYLNQVDKAKDQLANTPLPLPKARVNKVEKLSDLTIKMIQLNEYQHTGRIDYPINI